jgi:hypothetical protein
MYQLAAATLLPKDELAKLRECLAFKQTSLQAGRTRLLFRVRAQESISHATGN